MPTEKDKEIAEAQIRQLIDGWAKAIHEKYVDGVMSGYAQDVVAFDIATSLRYLGADEYRKNWDEWFPTWQGPINLKMSDLCITAGEDLAFSHSLNRISGTRTNGEETDVWMRWTACFRKINGNWLITHEHVSVPLYMDGGNRAAVDLKP
jgi:ketosteroid isomerase-like protein